MTDQTPPTDPVSDDAATGGTPNPPVDPISGPGTPTAGPPTGQPQPGPGQAYQANPPYQPYGQPQPPSATGYYPQPPLSDADQRLWATLGHVAGIIFAALGALVVYLVFKDRGAYVQYQNKESLNFQLTLLIAEVIGWVTSWLGIGVLILVAVWVVRIVFGIMAALATNRGEPYRYPFAIRMVS